MLALPTDCSGVVHVGANDGRERTTYAALRLPVLWIEALPESYQRLLSNLNGYSQQDALCALITDEPGRQYAFHVSSNSGRSSSIFELGQHKDTWPDVFYVEETALTSSTLEQVLPTLVEPYNTLVLDVQGAELLVLRGAGTRLHQFKYIHLEAADYPAYTNACLLGEVAAWLLAKGYHEVAREAFGWHPSGTGAYYNILFTRAAGAPDPTVAQ